MDTQVLTQTMQSMDLCQKVCTIIITFLLSPYNGVVRKVYQNNTLAWMTAVSFNAIMKSLVVDKNEKYLYFASFGGYPDVWRLSASTGAILDAQRM